jgi:hypothetical protein
MGDEQRVSWQELLAQSRDDGRRFIVHADDGEQNAISNAIS